MEILWWLAPAAVVTVIAMIWASWVGRPRNEERDQSEAAYLRFAAAIERDHPGAALPRPVGVRDRSTGIAVRPSRASDGVTVTSSQHSANEQANQQANEQVARLGDNQVDHDSNTA